MYAKLREMKIKREREREREGGEIFLMPGVKIKAAVVFENVSFNLFY